MRPDYFWTATLAHCLNKCKVQCKVAKVKRISQPFRLQNSPLIYVVAQVQISAVVAIDRYVPEIQEKLRRNGFPGFGSTQVPELTFEVPGTKPVVTPLARFEFLDREGRTGIVLTPKAIAVHTNQYGVFEEFKGIFAMALETVHVTAEPQLHERIGLRYVNLIELGEGETHQDYLPPQLLGYDTASLGVTGSNFSFIFEARTPHGVIYARHYPPQVANMFPPDLAVTALDYSFRQPPAAGRASLLDFDHSMNSKGDFVPDDILENLENLHGSLDNLFRHSVTDYALKKWGEG
jgi:uncharacterized protein (TIGR04255 family)